jgi:DNA polymerase III epsilon subunit-like protein
VLYNSIMQLSQPPPETYISVDVETAGPYPGQFSLLSIGASTVTGGESSFYVELKPVNNNFVEEALAISRLSMDKLAQNGLEPAKAMVDFKNWLGVVTLPGQRPIFVAFNAAFDWMFINYYFYHYLGHNPFGHTALDIKSYFMGLAGVAWKDTSMRLIGPRYLDKNQLEHNALQDARDQAEVFRKMLAQAQGDIF